MDSPAPQTPNSRESSQEQTIAQLCDSINQSESITEATEAIAYGIQQQLEAKLTEFSKIVGQTNLAAVDAMLEELTRVKTESSTVAGILQRLSAVVAPDIEPSRDEIVSYREAINNLEKFGTIIPTDMAMADYQHAQKRRLAWSLLWQSFARLIIKQIQAKIIQEPKS